MRLRRPRLLPIAVGMTGVLLVAKVAALWLDREPAVEPVRMSAAEVLARINPASGGDPKEAAGAGQKDAKGAADKPAGKAGAKSDGSHAATASAETPAKSGAAPTGDGAADLGLDDDNFDPMMLTRAEIELLQGLSARRIELERREHEFGLREQELVAGEQKLDEKIKALEDLKRTVEALLKQHDKEEDERIGSLVKIYETMKPKDAARILEGLDAPTLLAVVERMKEAKTAPILALLDPDRARQITQELVARHKLPENGKTDTGQAKPTASK